MTVHTAILGAGALGLTAALRLLQRGEAVTVYEREPLPGGLAAGFRLVQAAGAPWLEKFYHHLFRSDHSAIALIGELGLGGILEWQRALTVTLRYGVPHQLDSPISLLQFRPLPLPDRVRVGAALAWLRMLPDAHRLEGITAIDWIRRRMGSRAADVLWGPMLQAKFGAAAEEIAMPWFWARVHDRTAELGYVRGGFQVFYESLAQRVRDLGGVLEFETEVVGVEVAGAGLQVRSRRAGKPSDASFDRVVSTLPTRLTCRLVPALPAAYRERHDWGRAYGAHCLIVALDRPLTSSYWMNINDPGYPFMAVVEHTNLRSPEEYGGRHLVYFGNYRPMDDPLLVMPRDDVLGQFLPHLKRINPSFRESWVGDSWIFAAPFAQPIVTTDYRSHIPPFETPIPGLFVANMFQVYPHDRGQNYSIELAERLVQRLTAQPGRA